MSPAMMTGEMKRETRSTAGGSSRSFPAKRTNGSERSANVTSQATATTPAR